MGFLSTLGKIGAVAAPIAAIPFTGGMSMAALPGIIGGAGGALSALGSVAGGAAKGSAEQRRDDGNMSLLFQQLAQQAARDQANFGQQGARDVYQSQIEGAKFGASEQQRGMKNQLLAQLMGNMQDAKLTGGSGRIPNMEITGGLRPSALGADKSALMAALSQPTMQAPTFTPGPGYQAPPMPELPQAGGLEKWLGGIGLGGSILGAIGQVVRKQPQSFMANVPSGITAPPRG